MWISPIFWSISFSRAWKRLQRFARFAWGAPFSFLTRLWRSRWSDIYLLLNLITLTSILRLEFVVNSRFKISSRNIAMNDVFRTFTCHFLPMMRSKLQRHFQSWNLKSSQIFHISMQNSATAGQEMFISWKHITCLLRYLYSIWI